MRNADVALADVALDHWRDRAVAAEERARRLEDSLALARAILARVSSLAKCVVLPDATNPPADSIGTVRAIYRNVSEFDQGGQA